MSDRSTTVDPVEWLASDDRARAPEDGVALCLSGGGYRAMLFHAGVLWRLYGAGQLASVARISSVSGGSLTAAVLGLRWNALSFEPLADDFAVEIIGPVRRLASCTIDLPSVIRGLLLPGRVGDHVAAALDDVLYGRATLQNLPDAPRFVFNATNVQSGALWRFAKPYMRDWRVGEVISPDVPLARAVAASAAFPPFLSPFRLRLDPAAFTPDSGDDLQRPPFTVAAVLSDGGVYDNLGLETVWKRYRTVLASDGGGKIADEGRPKTDWLRHAYRVFGVVDNQVRSLRKRALISSYKRPRASPEARLGAYWGIRSNIEHFPASKPLPAPYERTIRLANTPTRLKGMDDELQERLINWGFAICDVALRSHVDPDLPEPSDFPYPAAGV